MIQVELAAADVAGPFDGWEFVRHTSWLRQWPELQIPVSGGAGMGKLP